MINVSKKCLKRAVLLKLFICRLITDHTSFWLLFFRLKLPCLTTPNKQLISIRRCFSLDSILLRKPLEDEKGTGRAIFWVHYHDFNLSMMIQRLFLTKNKSLVLVRLAIFLNYPIMIFFSEFVQTFPIFTTAYYLGIVPNFVWFQAYLI